MKFIVHIESPSRMNTYRWIAFGAGASATSRKSAADAIDHLLENLSNAHHMKVTRSHLILKPS